MEKPPVPVTFRKTNNKKASPPSAPSSLPPTKNINSGDISRLKTEGSFLVKAGEHSAGKKNLFGCGMRAH